MDFTFTEEQLAAAEAARGVFAGVAPDAVPSPALTTGAVAEGFDRELWSRLAGADLTGLLLDEQYGGAGLDAIALCLVLRESARVLARVPLLEHSAAIAAVQAYGGTELGERLLAQAGRGERVLTVAAHGRTGHDAAELAVTARRDGQAWVLDGVQTAVPWAYDADLILVPAHTGADRTVLALVPREQEGLELAEQVSTSGERLAELRLRSARVSAGDVIEAEGAGEWLHALLATGTCALALGLGERVLRMTSEYTGKREQFGYPVATFQAVAVQAADRYIDLRAMEATLWQAAWRVASDAPGALPAAGDVAVAKIWAAEGVRRVVQTAQHLHGGFGADTDYPLHRYHAWAKQLELALGPAAAYEDRLGDLLAAHPLG
ncbi:alkylation response protein AidB-like acyl-CoA dehydrogenase [Streptomyces griseochromogenes]|uniref:Acyl-CoA dehydrogenase n=1 Tax=Streptomyces griseochromogenes TaxID=68214 RepID=A0A1B1ANS0_9ACTN|nr:acyl-CoA dehydrogenase family protein [Streptomyces griseochromogenes]ANP48217.1 acyl-CoA dehydrogenase [Streptomyces griseochromogenes]MBP2050858.1 alkylation response protein AidB-like acyl-CoA dehydrogenase [Streptomyces griseochromogenes]